MPVLLRGGAEEVEEVSDPSPDLVGVAVHLTTPHVLLTRSHLSLGLQVSGCGYEWVWLVPGNC